MRQDQASEDFWFLNGRVSIRRSSSAGADGVVITEHLMVRGDSPPLHLHHTEDEVFHVIEGEVRFRVGDAEVVGKAGDTFLGPKGLPHSFRIESDQARIITIATGADFEGMVREMARPAGPGLPPFVEPDDAMIAALTAACERHNISILGPPLS